MTGRFLALLFAAGILLASFHPASAQAVEPALANTNGPHNETPMAFGLQGIWSSPDCTAAREAYIIGPHYTLLYRPGYFRLGAIQSWRQEEDDGDTLYQFRSNRGTALIKKTNDGLMKIRMIDVNPKAPLKSAWGSLEDESAREFAHCAKLFDSGAGFGQDEVNAVFLLDSAFTACKDTSPDNFKEAASCHKALFALTDSNKNKSLDRTELERIYRQLFFVLSSSMYCGGLGYPETSPAEAKDFATAILGASQSVTYDQLMARLNTPEFIAGRIFTFTENFGNIQALLPFAPGADTLKSCEMVEPENQKRLGTVALPDTGPSEATQAPLPEETVKPAPLPAQALPE
jgi:hypothetical protein